MRYIGGGVGHFKQEIGCATADGKTTGRLHSHELASKMLIILNPAGDEQQQGEDEDDGKGKGKGKDNGASEGEAEHDNEDVEDRDEEGWEDDAEIELVDSVDLGGSDDEGDEFHEF
jgi:hypothetical protein